jgi:hypothetical protein
LESLRESRANLSPRYHRKPGVESAPLNEEEIIFHAETQKFIMLNETGSFLWSRLSEPRSPEELAESLCESFTSVTTSQVLPDVERTLRRLEELEFVVAEATSETRGS